MKAPRWLAHGWLMGIGLGLAGAADAHHSRSAFNLDAIVEIEGQVVEVAWTNPHYYLVVDDISDANRWTLEGHSIPGLVRNGWQKDTLTVGSRVRVVANPNRQTGVAFGLLNSVTRSDGQTFYSFKPTAAMAARVKPPVMPSTDFTGTWRLQRSLRKNLIAAGPPMTWPLTEAARTQALQFDATLDPSLRCEYRGLPRMLSWPYAQQWRQQAGGYQVRIEHAVEQRWLATAAQSEPPGLSDQWGLGRSRIVTQTASRLVVVTDEFASHPWGLARGIDSGPAKQLTETYTLLDNGYRLRLDYTVSDPEMLTASATDTFFYDKVADYTFAEEPACDVATATRHLEFETTR